MKSNISFNQAANEYKKTKHFKKITKTMIILCVVWFCITIIGILFYSFVNENVGNIITIIGGALIFFTIDVWIEIFVSAAKRIKKELESKELNK